MLRLTTDAGDTVTLSDIIREHGRDLRDRIEAAQKKPGAAGVREADGLLQKLKKLSTQAGAVGYQLDGDRKPGISAELAELRRTLARHEQSKGTR